MKSCLKCKHVKFDELWGEYKCLKYGVRLKEKYFEKQCDGYVSKEKTDEQ